MIREWLKKITDKNRPAGQYLKDTDFLLVVWFYAETQAVNSWVVSGGSG